MADLDFTIHGKPGEIAAATFREAIGNAVGLLREFDSAISGKSLGSLRWYVSRLHSNGSLTVGFSSKAKKPSRAKQPHDYSPAITDTFMSGLDVLETKGILPPYLSEQGLQKAELLSGLIGRNGASGFRFSYAHQSVDVTSKTNENVRHLLPITRVAIGSVEGKLEAINLHHKPRFIVYHSITKKAVTCEFNEAELLDDIKRCLGKRVVVSGELKKNVNGDTLRVKMDAIRVIGEAITKDRFADISGLGEPSFTGFETTEDYLRNIRG